MCCFLHKTGPGYSHVLAIYRMLSSENNSTCFQWAMVSAGLAVRPHLLQWYLKYQQPLDPRRCRVCQHQVSKAFKQALPWSLGAVLTGETQLPARCLLAFGQSPRCPVAKQFQQNSPLALIHSWNYPIVTPLQCLHVRLVKAVKQQVLWVANFIHLPACNEKFIIYQWT